MYWKLIALVVGSVFALTIILAWSLYTMSKQADRWAEEMAELERERRELEEGE